MPVFLFHPISSFLYPSGILLISILLNTGSPAEAAADRGRPREDLRELADGFRGVGTADLHQGLCGGKGRWKRGMRSAGGFKVLLVRAC